jgi:AraC-like DNA-binding protein
MEAIKKITTVDQANALVGKETLHPLVTVLDFAMCSPMEYIRMNLGLYGIFLKDIKNADIVYGRHQYDYQQGTLIFIAPGQIVGLGSRQEGELFQPTGWGLMFHPDFLHGTSLSKHIKDCTFFSYGIHEALHTSDEERRTIIDCLKKIEKELTRSIDKHSKKLIASNIELLLNYCERFYDRQFITRDHVNKDILTRFENILNDYFQSGKASEEGIPTVTFCASKLNLSANYFGDLIKKESGKTAQEYIQQKIIEVAKEQIFDFSKSIAEVSYQLGFKYPQHFIRLFKQKVGYTPKEYRTLN